VTNTNPIDQLKKAVKLQVKDFSSPHPVKMDKTFEHAEGKRYNKKYLDKF
jgi:hypothetical protein